MILTLSSHNIACVPVSVFSLYSVILKYALHCSLLACIKLKTNTCSLQSTSRTPTSAIQKKFDLKDLLCKTGIPWDDETEVNLDDTGSDISTPVIARVNKLSELVTGLLWPLCRWNTLAFCTVNCALGLVCQLQDTHLHVGAGDVAQPEAKQLN